MKKTTFTELIFKGFLLFSIFTVVQGVPGFDSVNRIWIAMMSIAIVFRMLQYKYTVTEFLVLLLTIVIHLIALMFTDFPLVHTNVLFYLLLWVVLYLFFAKGKNKIIATMESSSQYIDGILWIWTILVGISAFMPSSYKDNYFFSFCDSSFRLMPTTLMIMGLSMYRAISAKSAKYYWFLLLPTYAGLMNQSRTYFGVYFCFLVMFAYMQFNNKKMFYAVIIPVASIFVTLSAIAGIGDKFEAVQYTNTSYFDYWGTITNGRTIFWEMDLKAFFALPFWQQFVGNGFNFVYDVNAAGFAKIWAHNDIINLLMNFGYIGVWIYLWVFFEMNNVYLRGNDRIPLLVRVLFHIAVFINSMWNMSYTYTCAVIAYPLILCAINKKYDGSHEST